MTLSENYHCYYCLSSVLPISENYHA
ncbi:hypothetical protein MRB53_016670 [Persea americana]|uniref:Uncharacterized protein n=1 Tax=Persea americana TaxID=3435 RepID=A0ACC2M2Y1_PERAE|nr:hypothetical protein MRB53_016670 [Persea americana]